jgi:transketolase
VECWELALQAHTRPSVLALTRQNLPLLRKDAEAHNRCATGAYELLAADDGKAQVSLFASGSEVAIAVEAKRILATRGISSRVVSVPCIELLLELPEKERAAIVGTAPVKVAIEAAVRQGWDAVIGSNGLFVGMTDFGASAPYKELFTRFGITPDKVAEAAQSALAKR